MKAYLDLLRDILLNCEEKENRTGTDTISVHGRQTRFDLRSGFPLVTTKKVNWRAAILEMLWFLRGELNTSWLKEQGVGIWDAWADENGNTGPIYGVQWRRWKKPDGTEVDQIREAERLLKEQPNSRRNIVTAWNPGELEDMCLPPCHRSFQLLVGGAEMNQLDMIVDLRSWDVPIGGPFNIAGYAALLMMFAASHGFRARELVINSGDTHIYVNQLAGVREQVSRIPDKPPRMNLTPRDSVLDYTIEDFELLDYSPQAPIKMPVAV